MFLPQVRVSVLGRRCRLLLLLFLLYRLLLFHDPVLRPLILSLLELILSLVVGVVLGVQLTIDGTLEKKRSQ